MRGKMPKRKRAGILDDGDTMESERGVSSSAVLSYGDKQRLQRGSDERAVKEREIVTAELLAHQTAKSRASLEADECGCERGIGSTGT
jgi:hypothetical protein